MTFWTELLLFQLQFLFFSSYDLSKFLHQKKFHFLKKWKATSKCFYRSLVILGFVCKKAHFSSYVILWGNTRLISKVFLKFVFVLGKCSYFLPKLETQKIRVLKNNNSVTLHNLKKRVKKQVKLCLISATVFSSCSKWLLW